MGNPLSLATQRLFGKHEGQPQICSSSCRSIREKRRTPQSDWVLKEQSPFITLFICVCVCVTQADSEEERGREKEREPSPPPSHHLLCGPISQSRSNFYANAYGPIWKELPSVVGLRRGGEGTVGLRCCNRHADA